jgi:hypothetical protein
VGCSKRQIWFLHLNCWGDSESSLSFTKNKRVSSVAQVSMRKAQWRNPRSPWIQFCLSESVFRPIPFAASGAGKWAQNNPGRWGLGQADCFLPRRNPRGESCSPRQSRPGIRLWVSSSLTSNDFKFECDSMFQVTKGARGKGNLQKIEGFLPTGARDDNKKGAAMCGVTSWSTDYVET